MPVIPKYQKGAQNECLSFCLSAGVLIVCGRFQVFFSFLYLIWLSPSSVENHSSEMMDDAYTHIHRYMFQKMKMFITKCVAEHYFLVAK